MKHLLLENAIMELQQNLVRRWYPAVKHGPPVLAPEGPLEGKRLHIWSPPLPAEDGSGWRMWYIGGEELHALYATSEDGLHWQRPKLGLVEHEGSRDNNLVDLGFDAGRKERRLVLCRADDCDAQEPHRALTRVGGRLRPMSSRDGLTWRLHDDLPGIPSDDEYRLGYDPVTRRLVATAKLGGRRGRAAYAVPEYGRAVAVSTSTDGLDWSEPEVVFHADFRDRRAGEDGVALHLEDHSLLSPIFVDPEHSWTDVYNMPVFRYENLYMALPVMFHQCGLWQYPGRPNEHNQDGLLWPSLAWSRDLREWSRPHRREAFIPLAPCDDEAIYDNGAIHACAPVRRGDEMWFYYYGSRFSHVSMALLEEIGLADGDRPLGAIFLAKLRLDGFASLEAGDEPGMILTRPLTVDGAKLRVNARTKGGEIRAEIRDAATGRAIPGFSMGDAVHLRTVQFADGSVQPRALGWGARFDDDPAEDDSVPFSGDSVCAPIRWRGGDDVSALRGRSVRVLFAMRNAEIYSFGFTDEEW